MRPSTARVHGVFLVLVATVAGCSWDGDEEPESATASSSFVTELVRLGREETFGRVGLSAVGGTTRIVVEVAEVQPREPPHVTTGNCDVLGGGVVYELDPFRDRVSETVVDIELTPLRRMGYVVIVGVRRFGPVGGLCADLAKSQPPSATPTFE
jgi:hypothetical protein